MKKFLKVIGIIILVLAVILGVTYLSFREPANQLVEIFGEEDFTKAVGAIFKVNFSGEEKVELEENKYIIKPDYESTLDSLMKEEYDKPEKEVIGDLVLYSDKSGNIASVSLDVYPQFVIAEVQVKETQSTEYELIIGNNKNGLVKIVDSKKNDDYDYDVYLYNCSINVRILARTLTLKNALNDGDIKAEQILNKAENDAKGGLISKYTFVDDQYALYQYGNYTVIKFNTDDGNEDLYICRFGTKLSNLVKDNKEIKEKEAEIDAENKAKNEIEKEKKKTTNTTTSNTTKKTTNTTNTSKKTTNTTKSENKV